MIECLCVGLGGFLGSIARYLIGLIPVNESFVFPIKTLIINIVGAFAIGIISALATKNNALDPRLLLMLKVGVCGGFTTFSTFAIESTALFHADHFMVGIAYIVLSVVLGICAVLLAQALMQ